MDNCCGGGPLFPPLGLFFKLKTETPFGNIPAPNSAHSRFTGKVSSAPQAPMRPTRGIKLHIKPR